MAIIAAIKKVLSPISDTTMTENEAMNACVNDAFCEKSKQKVG